jgi:hypothetical protein
VIAEMPANGSTVATALQKAKLLYVTSAEFHSAAAHKVSYAKTDDEAACASFCRDLSANALTKFDLVLPEVTT